MISEVQESGNDTRRLDRDMYDKEEPPLFNGTNITARRFVWLCQHPEWVKNHPDWMTKHSQIAERP